MSENNDINPTDTTISDASSSSKNTGITRRDFIKYSAGIVGATSLSGTLAACAAGGFGGSSGSSGGGTVTVNFWDMAWGGPNYFDVGQSLVNDFNNSHKGIKVVYRGTPWANWYQTFTTAIGSGTQPDISTGGSFMGAQFAGANDVLPLDDLVSQVKSDGSYNDYLPGVFGPMQYKGKTITWPWAIDIRIPFYRKDYFQQAGVQVPTTWDEWRAAAKKLTGNGKYGLVESGADNITEHVLEALMINNGGGLFDTNKKIDLATNPLNVEALRFFSNLVQDGSVDPATTGYQSTDAIRAFSRGDAAMLIGGPGWTAQMDPNVVKNVGLIPPVASPHGTKGTLYWVNNIIVYSATKHPNETKEFLLWWVKNNKPLWTKGACGPLPIRSSYFEDPILNTPIYQAIKSQYIPIAKSANAQAADVFPALNPLDGDGTMVTLGQNLLGKKDFNASIQTAQTGLQKVVDSNPG